MNMRSAKSSSMGTTVHTTESIAGSPESAAFRVELSLFCGPLDLLLYLARKSEVEIVEIPISQITRQFLEYLDVLKILDIDAVGDFVAMAATLMEMKSEELLPSGDGGLGGTGDIGDETSMEDPRKGLVRQLLEYREYREAAEALQRRSRIWQRQYPRLVDDFVESIRDPGDEPIVEIELWDLVSALARVLRSHEKIDEPRIRYDDTPIQVHIERILERLRALAETSAAEDCGGTGEGVLTFSSLFKPEMPRSRIVGIFLAVLELARHHGVRLTQEETYGDIELRWKPPVTPATAPL